MTPETAQSRRKAAQNQDAPPRVCVIGAGPTGLTTLKALLEAGLDPTGFDLGSDVGGLWVLDNDSGQSGAYESLTINTSTVESAFSDFPFPLGADDFPRHDKIAAYLSDYATHFNLRRWIRFQTEVQAAEPAPTGGYLVTSRSRLTGQVTQQHFDALIVCSGHHSRPSFPEIDLSQFQGQVLHAHHYRSPTRPLDLGGKRVVVVGMGNSAMDLASELAEVAQSVSLSARRGVWVIPKYIRGKPVDQGTLVPRWLPPAFRRKIVTWGFRALFGKMSDYGLPEPDHLIGEAHPTLSSTLPALVKSGRVQVHGTIKQLTGKAVTFSSGHTEEADVILFCTGYQVAFPFLSEDHVRVNGNHLPLFLRMVHPTHRSLFFVGLCQPLGAILPIAEAQARFIAAHLAGNYNLPSEAKLNAAISQEVAKNQARYVTSPRHTMQIDPAAYHQALAKEWRQGADRQQKNQGIPFIPSAKVVLELGESP